MFPTMFPYVYGLWEKIPDNILRGAGEGGEFHDMFNF